MRYSTLIFGFGFGLVALGASFHGFGQSEAPDSGSPTMKQKGYDSLTERIKEMGELRILVGLETDPDAPAETEIPRVQDLFAASFSPRLVDEIEELNRYSSIPFVLLRVSEKGLEAVIESELVKSIEEDLPVRHTDPPKKKKPSS